MEFEKKTQRKTKRFAARLKSSKGVKCVDLPGLCIVLCNVGQATGFGKDDLINLIEHNANNIAVPKFIPEKGESYSFVQFGTIEDAVVFYNSCNGKVRVRDSDTPIYMNYVEEVPDTDVVCGDEDPNGLTLLSNFITAEEEEKFLKIFDWTVDNDSNNLKNRQVQHYGYEFRYGTNDVDINDPLHETIPQECDLLWRRLRESGFELGTPDQLTVNKYDPGQGIPSHVDKHSPFGDTILSLSLGSDVVMDWKHHTGKYVPLLLPKRSLLIMQGEARYDWQHGIASRTWDPVAEYRTCPSGRHETVLSGAVQRRTRLSLTFRRTRRGPCACAYAALCDSAAKPTLDDLEDEVAANLEELHVHQVYEQIAEHFSATRHTAWPCVREFTRRAPPAALLLDLGAGNGKNLPHRGDLVQIACERSAGLLAQCGARVQRVRLDVLRAPLRDGCADRVLCVAVIHHFTTTARRLQAVKTIHRLLSATGRALITVWARDQSRSKYVCEGKQRAGRAAAAPGAGAGARGLPVHENRTPFRHADLLVPWQRRAARPHAQPDLTLLRYYHVFEEGELEALCAAAGLAVRESFHEQGNWGVVCAKH